jgi:hypothetical protein
MNGFGLVSDPVAIWSPRPGWASVRAIDGNLRCRGGLRHPMGRRCGTHRDMEVICEAQIALMV